MTAGVMSLVTVVGEGKEKMEKIEGSYGSEVAVDGGETMVMTRGKINMAEIEENVGRGLVVRNEALWMYNQQLEEEEGEVRGGGLVVAAEVERKAVKTKMVVEEDEAEHGEEETLKCQIKSNRPKPNPPWPTYPSPVQQSQTTKPTLISVTPNTPAKHKSISPNSMTRPIPGSNNPQPEPKPPWIRMHQPTQLQFNPLNSTTQTPKSIFHPALSQNPKIIKVNGVE